MKSSFKSICGALFLFLIAMTQGANAQQSTSAAAASSQDGCSQIAVIGAVRRPKRIDADHGLRLIEVLALAGGPNERAGKTVRMIHPCNCSPCDKPDLRGSKITVYNLVDVLRGRENASPYVTPGDIVAVPEADPVFVIGTVRATSIRFVEGLTVTRAIALAGGPRKSSELVAVRIYRNLSNAPRANPIRVNLKAAIESGAQDLRLQPLDIIEVSDDQGRFQLPGLLTPMPPIWDPPLFPRKDTSGS